MMFLLSLLAPLILSPFGALADEHGILQVHGSGTTNPSKCLWMLMDQFMDRAKVPIRMTYRAVGSSTGIFEHVGVNNTGPFAYVNYNDFGAGDIPVPTDQYDALKAKGIEMVSLPFVLGSVGVFLYNLVEENDDVDESKIHLTGCNLAKIFKREIVHWDDPEIVANNPKIQSALPYANFPISVARRVHGSSSTKSFTAYLNMVCPDVWPESMVGSTVDWDEDTMPCEGSGGMSACVKNTRGAIGYIDSGHGWEEDLVEVNLQNKAGRFISSKEAADTGGIGGALKEIPSRADADWGAVNLLNKDGEETWPITLVSYVFVRKDMSYFRSPSEATLLKAFLKSLYDPDYIGQCRQFGFSPVPTNARDIALTGISQLEVDAGNGTAADWTFEKKTQKGIGQGEYVISSKRRDYTEYLVSGNGDDISDVIEAITDLNQEVAKGSGFSSASASASAQPSQFTTDDEKKINAALGMASLSIILWGLTIIGLVVKRVTGM